MGFYGNLTNTARTQFQFDRIYPNRYSMERNIAKDGVYLGRYVLVEYDSEIHEDTIKIAYVSGRQTTEDNIVYYDNYYTTIDHTQEYVLNTFVPVAAGVVTSTNFSDYYVEENGLHHPATGFDEETIYYALDNGSIGNGVEKNEIIQTRNFDGTLNGEFFICAGANANNIALFDNITEQVQNNFLINYQIDITYYGPRQPEGAYSRAWDSTVWQKIYEGGEVKYIMIAELNTASPSFSITFDPPTQTPLAPHVDASSANNVYRVHLQPSWGFRIKEAEDEDHSDTKAYHIFSTYDSINNRVNQTRNEVDAAIYWNNKGLDVTTSIHDNDSANYISFEPTGKSGMSYVSHKGYIPTNDIIYKEGKIYYNYDENFFNYTAIDTTDLINQEIENPDSTYEYVTLPTYDINEFSINMPAFGNAIADFYDLVYGYNPNNKNLRYRDTGWKYYQGINRMGPDESLGGMTRDKSTVAGTLNYIHDLTGMIVSNLEELPTEQEVQNTLSSDLIYCLPSMNELVPDTYYFRAQTNKFDTTKINYNYTLVDKTNEPYLENCYFTLPAGASFDADDLDKDLGGLGYSNDYDYYKRTINGSTYKELGLLVNFLPGVYYYRIGSDYFCETGTNFESDRVYYSFDSSFRFRQITNDEVYHSNRGYYFDLSGLNENDPLAIAYENAQLVDMGWIDTEDTFFNSNKIYYTLQGYHIIPYTDWEPDTLIPSTPRIIERVPSDISDGVTLVSSLNSPLDLYNSPYVRQVTENNLEFKASYLANAFFYIDEVGELELDSNTTVPIYDYCVDTEYPYTTDREYYRTTPVPLGDDITIYQPNRYFYFDNDDGETIPFNENAQIGDADYVQALAHVDANEYPTQGRYYWKVLLSDPQLVMTADGQIMYIQTIIGWDRVSNLLSVTGQFIVYNEETTLYELSPQNPVFNFYYMDEEDSTKYHMIHMNNRNTVLANKTYRLFSINVDFDNAETLSNRDFYIKDTYYYFDEARNLLMDHNLTYNDSYYYYYLTANAETGVLNNMTEVQFYIPGAYYYQLGNVYILDNNDTNVDPDNRIYYDKDSYCVAEDMLGLYAKGCRWNTKANMVPCTITLGVAEPWYELREIGNVSTKTNSLNNLILRYNKVLADNDQVIRSNNTVQGTLNLYKDKITQIESDIEPNRIVITDPYGRITNSDYSIQQLLNRIVELENRVEALET